MAFKPAPISDNMVGLLKMPAWVIPVRAETREIVAFLSGSALTVLDAPISDPSHGLPLKLLTYQLGLKAATATSKLEGGWPEKRISATHIILRRLMRRAAPMSFWRDAVRLRLTGGDWQSSLEGIVGPNFEEDCNGWMEFGLARFETHGPLVGSVSAMRAVLETDDRVERIACLLSDVVLAQSLNWTSVLPITAQCSTKAMMRNLIADEQGAELKV